MADENEVTVVEVTVEEITVVVVDQDGTVGPKGNDGNNGWSPQHSIVADGERRVLQLVNWTGGTGTVPSGIGRYVGDTGLVVDIANGIDIRGAIGQVGQQGEPGAPGQVLIGDGANIFTEDHDPISSDGGPGDLWINTITNDVFSKIGDPAAWVLQTNIKGNTGAQGITGDTGLQGAAGLNGTNGYSPILALVVDGLRIVMQVIDWAGGTGAKPATGQYVGPTGMVTLIADAINVRGATGGQGTNGNNGSNGLNFYNGTGVPSAGLGTTGELYLDLATLLLYRKQGAPPAWTVLGSIKGSDGAAGAAGTAGAQGLSFRYGNTNPASGLGNDGDTYFNTTSFHLFTKAAGAWTDVGVIKGADGADGAPGVNGKSIRFGAGVPLDSLGVDGDGYIATDTSILYVKAAGHYTAAGSLKGADGDDGADGADGTNGSSMRVGTGAPASGLGNDGDTYLNLTDFTISTKAAGAWTNRGTIKGADGDDGTDGDPGAAGTNGLSFRWGAGAPSNGLGIDGETYLQTSNYHLFTKASGVWTDIGGLKGADGADGADGDDGAPGAAGTSVRYGPGAPASGLGNVGDVYVSSDSFHLYTKTGVSTWVDNGSLRGSDGATGDTGEQGEQGTRGATWFTGSGAPGGGVTGMIANDFYFNTANGDVYKYSGSSWGSVIASLKGPTGTTGSTGPAGASTLVGAGAPASGLGSVNDSYINSTNGDLYLKTGASTWTSQGSLKGATGATGVKGDTGTFAGFSWTFASAGGNAASGKWTLNNSADVATVLKLSATGDAASPLGTLNALRNFVALATASGDPCGILTMQGRANNDLWSFIVHTFVEDGANGQFTLGITGTSNPSVGSLPTNLASYVLNYSQAGAAGAAGSAGSAGAAGSNGTNGSNGAAGFNFLSGAGTPSSGAGNNGDSYLNTTNGDVYTKASGSWGTATGNIRGVAGTGVPAGGSTGQALVKSSNSDYATTWSTISGGGGSGSGGSFKRANYLFDTTTTDSLPAAGKFRFSTSGSTFSTSVAATMFINVTDNAANDLTTFLDSIAPDLLNLYTIKIWSTTINSVGADYQVRSGQITSITTASGYRKIGIRWTNLYETLPANATSCTIQIDQSADGSYNAGTVPVTPSNVRFYGIPGFQPVTQKTLTLVNQKTYMVPFAIERPIYVVTMGYYLSTAATAGTWRGWICRMTGRQSDTPYGGELVYDTTGAANMGTTGLKAAANAINSFRGVLEPGSYMLCLNTTFTGTPVATCLAGILKDMGNINPATSGWGLQTEYAITGTDYTTTLPNPFPAASNASPTITQIPLNTIFDGFVCPLLLQFYNLS